MKQRTRIGREAALTLILLAAAGRGFYLLNCFTPYFADDFAHSFSFHTTLRLSGLEDILPSMQAFYFVENGRVVVHAISQVFLLYEKTLFNVVNVFVFLGFALLICIHGTGRRPRPAPLLFVLCALFLLTPAFGESFLWLTGACNYLYGITIVLLYLLPYRLAAETRDHAPSLPLEVLKFLAMSAFGCIAGATNENTCIALIAMVLAHLLRRRLLGMPVRLWMLSPGPIVGCLLMLLAPSQQARLASAGGTGLGLALRNTVRITTNLAQYFYPLLVPLAALLIWQFRGQRTWANAKEMLVRFSMPLIYLLGFLGSVYSMIVSPEFPLRVWSGPLALLLIVTLAVLRSGELPAGDWTRVRRLTLVLLAVCALSAYTTGLAECKGRYADFAARDAVLRQCAAEGQAEAAVPALYSTNRFSVYYHQSGELTDNPANWQNASMAVYYGLDRVVRDGVLLY